MTIPMRHSSTGDSSQTSAPILWCRSILWPKCPAPGAGIKTVQLTSYFPYINQVLVYWFSVKRSWSLIFASQRKEVGGWYIFFARSARGLDISPPPLSTLWRHPCSCPPIPTDPRVLYRYVGFYSSLGCIVRWVRGRGVLRVATVYQRRGRG